MASAVKRIRAGSVEDLIEQINQLNIERDVRKMRSIMKKILSISSQETRSVELLSPCVVKLLATTDVISKKLAAWFVARHIQLYPEPFLLAINTLVTDTRDPSPLTRSLALRTLSCVSGPYVTEYALPAVIRALDDSNAPVRRAASLACCRLSKVSADDVLDGGVVDRLYGMIRDSDPVVVLNCLSALDEILREEGGVVMNRNIVMHLISRIQSFPDRNLSYVLSYLMKYNMDECKDRTEIVSVMNSLDPFLCSRSVSVLVSVTHYFLQLSQQCQLNISQDIVRRVKDQVIDLLKASGDDSESMFTLLELIEVLMSHDSAAFSPYYRSFLCRLSDPLYIKLHKIHLLGLVSVGCVGESLDEIVEELSRYCRESGARTVCKSLSTLLHISTCTTTCQSTCLSALICVCVSRVDMYLSSPHVKSHQIITSHVLQILESLSLIEESDRTRVSECVTRLSGVLEDDTCSHALKCSYLSLFTRHGAQVNIAPYVLEQFINKIIDTPDGERGDDSRAALLDSCLSAAVALFVARPAELQHVLGAVLQLCMQSAHPELRDRAKLYYTALNTSIDLVKQLIQSS